MKRRKPKREKIAVVEAEVIEAQTRKLTPSGKSLGPVEGEAAKTRLDRPRRASGGAVGPVDTPSLGAITMLGLEEAKRQERARLSRYKTLK